MIRLIQTKLVDPLGEELVDVQSLPSGDGVGSNQRMGSGEVLTRVLRVTTRLFELLTWRSVEGVTDMGGGEGGEEVLHRWGETIVRGVG